MTRNVLQKLHARPHESAWGDPGCVTGRVANSHSFQKTTVGCKTKAAGNSVTKQSLCRRKRTFDLAPAEAAGQRKAGTTGLGVGPWGCGLARPFPWLLPMLRTPMSWTHDMRKGLLGVECPGRNSCPDGPDKK